MPKKFVFRPPIDGIWHHFHLIYCCCNSCAVYILPLLLFFVLFIFFCDKSEKNSSEKGEDFPENPYIFNKIIPIIYNGSTK